MIPTDGIVRLLIMTKLSMINGGKYQNQRIAKIIEIDPGYLRWVYYHLSKISFNDDVLKSIQIPDEFKIDKPGKDLDMYHALNLFSLYQMTDEERIIHFLENKRRRKINAIQWLIRAKNQDNKVLNKASLKSLNQSNNKFRFDYHDI